MRFWTSTSNSAALPYRYNGKELEAMNGLNEYDYGARRRETGIPVWTTLDPLAEKKPWMSPYAYCSDNPMNRIDPDGRIDWWAVGEGVLNTIGGGLQMAAGATTSWTGVGAGLIITGMAEGSCGLAQLTCGLVSDNSKQSQQTLKDMPKGVGSIAGEVAAEATGNKNVKTAFEVGETILTTAVDLPKTVLQGVGQGVLLAGQAAVTIKDNNQNSSTNKNSNNSTDKNNNTKPTNNKSSSSQDSNANSPIAPKKEEVKIPSIVNMPNNNH
jgi:RHS repeat-associated protein